MKKADTRKVKVVKDDALIVAVDNGDESRILHHPRRTELKDF